MTSLPAGQIDPWFRDRLFLSQLPRRLRLLAGYHQLATKIWPSAYRTKGWIRGGAFLVRLMGRWSSRVGVSTSLPVTIDGVRAVVDFSDGRFPHVLTELRGDSPAQAAFSKLLNAGDTFIDIGANQGTFAVHAAASVGPAGTVIAIEPQPKLARLVSDSLRLSPSAQWSVHEFACGEERQLAPLHLRPGNSGVATLNPVDPAAGGAITVEVDRIDDRLDLEQIQGRCVIKLDVEGNELHALRGATRLLDRFRPVVLFELAPRLLERAGTPAGALLTFFDDRHYSLSTVESFPHTVRVPEIDVGIQQNLIAIPTEQL